MLVLRYTALLVAQITPRRVVKKGTDAIFHTSQRQMKSQQVGKQMVLKQVKTKTTNYVNTLTQERDVRERDARSPINSCHHASGGLTVLSKGVGLTIRKVAMQQEQPLE